MRFINESGSVVIPVDFSEPSLYALEVAGELAGDRPVIALHVIPGLYAVDPQVAIGNFYDDEALQTARVHLREILDESGHEEFSAVVRIGDPATVIADYVRRESSALVVIPSHGRRGFRRLLMGSVAERVMREATCPTLVLRIDPEEHEGRETKDRAKGA